MSPASQARSLLLVYTGEGKGKTSAAVGQAVRAVGHGLRVGFAQFMKEPDIAGEQKVLEQLLGLHFQVSGAGFYTSPAQFPVHREKVVALLTNIHSWLDNGLDMLILDESLYSLGYELLQQQELEEIITRCARKGCHLVLTGRGLPPWIEEKADLVSEILPRKHHHDQGKGALPGIEF